MKRSQTASKTAGLCLALTLSFPLLAADPPDDVLATFGDSITLRATDFEAAVRALPAHLRAHAKESPKSATQLLESILLNRVLAEEARKLGLDQTPVAKAEVQQVAERALSVHRMEAFEASLTIPDYTQAARERYELNKDKYMEPEQVHAAHILIATHGKDPAEARKTAEEVKAKLAAGGDFAALAAAYSDDKGNKGKGGDLGFFGRNKMVKEFEQAVFAMKEPGEISEVVKTAFGFHVIKFIERKPPRQKPFEEVKESLIAPMRAQLVNAEKARYTSKIRNDPSIRLNTVAIDRLLGITPEGKPAEAKPAAEAAAGK